MHPPFSLSLRLLSGTALTLLAITPAFAQDTGYSFTLDPIVVRESDEVGDAADRATAVYVSDAELERARMGDARDLFQGIASVSVGSSIPMSQKIFVNGIDIVNMTTTIDGAMQNNRTFHHSSATVFDPGLLKFVRVDPGIAAADAGPNAVAGAVVMETIDAADFLDEGDNFGGKLQLSYDWNAETFGRALTLVGREGGFEALAYGRMLDGENYSDGSGNEILGTAADMQSGLLKLAYESDLGHRIEVSGQKLVDDALRPWRADFAGFTGVETDLRVYDTVRNSYALVYEFTQGGPLFNPRFNLGYSDAKVDVTDPYGSESTASTLSAKLENTFELSEVDSVVVGVDYYDKQSDYDDDYDSDLNENAQNIGLYAQARLQPLDALKLSAGFRYDWQDFEGVDGFKDTVEGWSGNLSASYFITEQVALRGGYSSTFGGLQLEDSYYFWGPVYDSWDYEDLEASRSENTSVGIDWYSDFGLSLGAEVFQIKINNARYQGETHDVASEGFNIAGAYDWHTGSARLTYNDSNVTSDGDAEDSYTLRGYGTPIGQILAFQVQQEISQLETVVGASFNMAWDEKASGTYADTTLKGYQVLDLFAEWRPERLNGLTVRATLDNVFDEDYADRASYGGDFEEIAEYQQPGRTFGVELTYNF